MVDRTPGKPGVFLSRRPRDKSLLFAPPGQAVPPGTRPRDRTTANPSISCCPARDNYPGQLLPLVPLSRVYPSPRGGDTSRSRDGGSRPGQSRDRSTARKLTPMFKKMDVACHSLEVANRRRFLNRHASPRQSARRGWGSAIRRTIGRERPSTLPARGDGPPRYADRGGYRGMAGRPSAKSLAKTLE
jgi:hypothetical protein